jgi:beta-ring hydroxylase
VPAGADIFISTWNLHRSPLLWDRPHDFDPGRFGPLSAPIPNEFTENYRYLPFGGGLRKCIGDQFAQLESISALAVIMRRFEFELDPEGPEVGMTTGATIHTTNGLLLKLRKRDLPPSAGGGAAPSAGVAGGEPAGGGGGGKTGGGCPMGFKGAAKADAQMAR